MVSWSSARDVSFLSLQSAVFCAQCELISENSTPHCLACGSKAVLSLSRVLGGSLRNQQTAHLIEDVELDRMVRELLRSVPRSASQTGQQTYAGPQLVPSRHHLRNAASHAVEVDSETAAAGEPIELGPTEMQLEPGINFIAERAQALTGATGAAIALRSGDEIVCRARAGRTAPDVGVRLQTDTGLSADCVRRGEILLCHDAESSSRVDLASCRTLGVRSILVAPLRHLRHTLGVFEVLSAAPYAFDHRDVATMQLLSSMMVAAMSRQRSVRSA